MRCQVYCDCPSCLLGVADMEEDKMVRHECIDGWPEYDAQGIYLCHVCVECVEDKLSGYRPEILSGYSQADVDEPIEPDDWSADVR